MDRMMRSCPVHCNSLNAESDFNSDMAARGCHVEGEDSSESQQQPECGVSDRADGTPHVSRSWRVSIDDLPDEILINIFSHMSFTELVDVVQKVCSRWKRLSQDAHLWSDKEYLITCRRPPNFDYLKADKTDQEAVQTLCDCPNLRRVSMCRGAKARVLRALSSRCRRLSVLHLHPTQKLSYEVLKNLVENCSRIHTLRISNELLKLRKFAEVVSQFEHLCVLELEEHFKKNPPVLAPLGYGCPQLTVVNFGFMTVDMDDLRHFLHSKRNTLKSICIKWTMEERRCVLPLLSVCADSLEHLELYEFDIVDEEAREAFTALGSLKNLQELKMSIINPTPPGVASLAFQDGGLAKLRVLHLQYGSFLDDETLVSACRGCPALLELNVREAERLTDAAFSQLHRLHHLQVLDVSGCSSLGGALLPFVASLPRLHTLCMEELDLAKLQPGLASILQLSALRCLLLNYSTLTGMPFRQFPGKLVNLRELYICWCQQDREVIDVLTQQMPSLKLYFAIREQEAAPDDADVGHEYEEDSSDEEQDSAGELGDVSESEEDSVG